MIITANFQKDGASEDTSILHLASSNNNNNDNNKNNNNNNNNNSNQFNDQQI